MEPKGSVKSFLIGDDLSHSAELFSVKDVNFVIFVQGDSWYSVHKGRNDIPDLTGQAVCVEREAHRIYFGEVELVVGVWKWIVSNPIHDGSLLSLLESLPNRFSVFESDYGVG